MFSAFASRMIQQNSTPLHRALSRWKILWEELISQTSNKGEMELAGFMASANELWLVAKAILRNNSEEYFSLFDGQSLQPFNELFPSIIDMDDQWEWKFDFSTLIPAWRKSCLSEPLFREYPLLNADWLPRKAIPAKWISHYVRSGTDNGQDGPWGHPSKERKPQNKQFTSHTLGDKLQDSPE